MLVSVSSLIDQFSNIVIQFDALSPIFVNSNSKLVTVAGHEAVKSSSASDLHLKVHIIFDELKLKIDFG